MSAFFPLPLVIQDYAHHEHHDLLVSPSSSEPEFSLSEELSFELSYLSSDLEYRVENQLAPMVSGHVTTARQKISDVRATGTQFIDNTLSKARETEAHVRTNAQNRVAEIRAKADDILEDTRFEIGELYDRAAEKAQTAVNTPRNCGAAFFRNIILEPFLSRSQASESPTP